MYVCRHTGFKKKINKSSVAYSVFIVIYLFKGPKQMLHAIVKEVNGNGQIDRTLLIPREGSSGKFRKLM